MFYCDVLLYRSVNDGSCWMPFQGDDFLVIGFVCHQLQRRLAVILLECWEYCHMLWENPKPTRKFCNVALFLTEFMSYNAMENQAHAVRRADPRFLQFEQ